MADAYRYCEDPSISPQPMEYRLLSYIDKFGSQAVLGRILYAKEINRMIAVDNIIKAYQLRSNSDNWANWSAKYPFYSRILNEAMRLSEEEDNG